MNGAADIAASNDGPLVSVVIPTYNRAELLPAAIESVLSQDYLRKEIVVVDDGSTDRTGDVLDNYAARVTIVHQRNAGPSAARNAGVHASHGDVLMFLDSDDVWLPGKIGLQIAALEAAGMQTPCCLGNITLAYASGKHTSSFALSLIEPGIDRGLWTNPLAVLATRFVLFNQSIAIRRSAMERVGGFDERHRTMEDYDLSLRLATLGPWAFIDQPLAVWNEGSVGSLTTQARKERLALVTTVTTIHETLRQLMQQQHRGHGEGERLRFEYWRGRVRLAAARWAVADNITERIAGHMLWYVERTFDRIYTRSPFYPAMRVLPFDEDRSSKLNQAD